MKKLLSVLCCLALLLCGPMSAGVRADFGGAEPAEDVVPLGDPSEYGEIPILEESETSVKEPLLMMLPEEPLTDGGGDLPAAYDVRDDIDVPATRNQGGWNTCWAMATMGAIEISALKKGITTETADTVNYSEWHLAYFLANRSVDPLGNISDDYNTFSMYHWIKEGGNPIFATMQLATWHGVASEAVTGTTYSAMTQSGYVDPAYAYLDAVHVENTYSVDVSDTEGRNTLKLFLMEYGAAVMCINYSDNYLYSGPFDDGEEDDPASEESDPEEQNLEETDPPAEEGSSEIMEEPAATETPETTETQEASGEESELTEETPAPTEEPSEELTPILETTENAGTDGSAEVIVETVDTSVCDGDSDVKMTTCYYQDAVTSTNHEVIVVGWDDSYPKENFSHSPKGVAPAEDGAWLCRNSYGASWKSDGGYFWVSYYDTCVSADTKSGKYPVNSRVVVYEVAPADNYDNCYQYDGAAVLANVTRGSIAPAYSYSITDSSVPNAVWYANVFTAAADSTCREEIRAAGTFTYGEEVPYTVYIYTDVAEGSDPTAGTLAASTSGTFTYAGFHTVELPEPVTIPEGSRFSVVIRVGTSANTSLYVPACQNNTLWHSENNCKSGQSFVSHTGSGDWEDCYTVTNQPNVRLKAYTVNVESPQTDTPDAWYEESVETLWAYGLISDGEVTSFCDGDVTRAQVVDRLWRLAGKPAAESSAFDDVSVGDEYYAAIAWAAEKGIALGSDDNGDGIYSFRPEDPVTREECVTLLWRYAGSPAVSTSLSDFGDADTVSAWALSAERWSVENGIQTGLAGYGVFLLRPDYRLTLAQLAEFIARLL